MQGIHERPRLDDRYRLGIIEPDLIFFLSSEGESRAVRGVPFVRVGPLLDGTRTAQEIVESLAGYLSPLDVHYVLDTLAGWRFLEEGSGLPMPAPPPVDSHARASDKALWVEDPGATDLAAALSSIRVPVAPDGLPVVLAWDYLDPRLRDRNAGALGRDEPWLLLRRGGSTLWVGPLFRPGRTGCWECLRSALAPQRPIAALWYRLAGPDCCLEMPPPPGWGGLAAAWLAHCWGGDPAALEDAFLTVSLETGAIARHCFPRLRHCPACGVDRGGELRPLVLAPRPVTSAADGGWRSAATRVTRRSLEPWVSGITGWIRDVTIRQVDPALPTHVAVATYPHPVLPDRFEDLAERPRIAAAGKGLTAMQAEVGALAEAIERQSGVFRGDEPRRRASFIDLGDEAIHPDACLLWSPEQRGQIGAPSALDPAMPLDWTPLWSLAHRRWKYLPTTLCYFAYRGGGWRAPASSNGCAAGSNREEAILQGLLELVERDAVAIWWYNRIARPAFAVPPALRQTFERARLVHERAGRDLSLLDCTADLGVPVAAAVSRPMRDEDAVLFGFGAHLDPAIAAGRALAELHQSWPEEAASKPAPGPAATGSGERWWLQPDPAVPHAPILAGPPPFDLREAIEDLVARLASRGLETLVLDQTRDGSPLAVVRVVVPGLRPWARRLAPGRLYDVPIVLGWLAAARREEDLNPETLEV